MCLDPRTPSGDVPELHLVTRDGPLRKMVDQLQGCLGAELGYRMTGWHEAWVWGQDDGFALFDHHDFLVERGTHRVIPDSECWDLTRIWMRPALRRRGLLSAAWPRWRERYGEFRVERPLSPSMAAFVQQRRDRFHERVEET